jgi:uncharacterized protein (TIGR02246 family)
LTDEQKIRDLITRWHVATAAGDLPEILPLMAEDVVFLTPGQPPMRGRDAFASGFRAVLEKARIESRGEPQEIRVAGDLAYSWTQLSVTVVPKDPAAPAVRRSGHTLTIFRREQDGQWVLFRDANMLTAEPAPGSS